MAYDRRYMVMQYLGELHTMTPWNTPAQYRMFRCGDDKWLLFDPIDLNGCSRLMQFPVLRKDLKPEIRRVFTVKTGGLYTTAKRNAYNDALETRRAARAHQAASFATLGQALDVLHS